MAREPRACVILEFDGRKPRLLGNFVDGKTAVETYEEYAERQKQWVSEAVGPPTSIVVKCTAYLYYLKLDRAYPVGQAPHTVLGTCMVDIERLYEKE